MAKNWAEGRIRPAKRPKGFGLWLLRRFVRNPPIIGTAAGVVANLVDLPVTGGLDFFARVAGETAAPCSLFAPGLILMAQKDESSLHVPLAISGLKLAVMPVVFWLLVSVVFPVNPER